MIESRTPKYLKLWSTASELKSFGDFLLFGFMHLTKWQSQEYNSYVSLFISFKNLDPKNLLDAFEVLGFYEGTYFPTIIDLIISFFVSTITSSIWFGKASLFFAVNPSVLYSTGLQEWLTLNIPLLDFGISTPTFLLWFFTIESGRF